MNGQRPIARGDSRVYSDLVRPPDQEFDQRKEKKIPNYRSLDPISLSFKPLGSGHSTIDFPLQADGSD